MPRDLLVLLKTNTNFNESVSLSTNNGRASFVALTMTDTAISRGGAGAQPLPGFLVEFFTQVEHVRSKIEAIMEKVEMVKQIHKSILESPYQEEEKRRNLETTMSDIKTLAGDVRNKLKLLEADHKKNSQIENYSKAKKRIQDIQISALYRMFIDVINDYNTSQINFRQSCKNRIKRQFEFAEKDVTNEELEDMIESGNPVILQQGIAAETQAAQRDLHELEARHEDIMKLEKSIKELFDLFSDMAILVESQGELIDKIGYHVEMAVDYVVTAKGATAQAVQYQSSARRKKIICFVIVGIALVVLALILYFTLR